MRRRSLIYKSPIRTVELMQEPVVHDLVACVEHSEYLRSSVSGQGFPQRTWWADIKVRLRNLNSWLDAPCSAE